MRSHKIRFFIVMAAMALATILGTASSSLACSPEDGCDPVCILPICGENNGIK